MRVSSPLPRPLRHLAVHLFITVFFSLGWTSVAAEAQTGPWDLDKLSKAPAVTWGASDGLVQELYYEGEPLDGQPTRVFAYLGRPAGSGVHQTPAMVLVHGGGGKAFKDWASHWAKRGYVALAMDLAGNGPNGRLPDGGPDQSDQIKFRNFTSEEADQMWTYHAVAAVVRGHSLLRSLPGVDKDQIGLTGISWGGYLTCIVAGIDSRFKVAVPVYGCGFLGDNSYWTDKSLAAMSSDARALWLQLFDPGEYVGNVDYPIFFVNGTTDFAYPMDSYQKTYRLVPEQWRHVSVAVNRPHGHIWTFPEVDTFVDSVLLQANPLPSMGSLQVDGSTVSAPVGNFKASGEVTLCYTTDTGVWQEREWKKVPARFDGARITADLPEERPMVAFLAVTDKAGNHVSSEHVELGSAE